MTENKKNTKKTILIVFVIALVIASVVLLVLKPFESKRTDDCESCTVKKPQTKENILAYDYIIDEMAKSEYWGVDHMHDYFSDEEIAKRKDKLPNATGWYLSDLASASFSRGYESTMTYNFSEFKVLCDDGVYTDEYDFKNNTYKVYESANPENVTYTTNIEEYKAAKDRYPNQPEKAIFDIEDIEESKTSFIKNSMMNYAYQFELAGCPILLQPEGTLESYKNKTITTPDEFKKSAISFGNYYDQRKWYEELPKDLESHCTPDGYCDCTPILLGVKEKINYVWEQDGYEYDLRNSKDIQWIDDYASLVNKLNELPSLLDTDEDANDNTNIAIVFVNLDKYDEIKESTDMLPNVTSNIFAYMVRPILKEAYGEDLVYFCDMKNLKNEVRVDIDNITDENFSRIGMHNGEDSRDSAVIIYKNNPKNGDQVFTRYWFYALEDLIFSGQYFEIYDPYYAVSGLSGNEWPYTLMYPISYLLTVDKNMQLEFGLR